MKVYLIFIVLILSSCTTIQNNDNLKKNYNFSEKMRLEEFVNELKVYSDNSSYPKIDN